MTARVDAGNMNFRVRDRLKQRHLSRKPRTRQRGIYVVEFAIVAGVFFFMMFAAIEVARLLFTWSALDAATQRGARVAAVCPLNNARISQVAIFGDGGGGSTVIPGIEESNIGIRYLTQAGNPTANIANVWYVEVSIQNYQHRMLIPETVANFAAPLLTAPAFTTTRPAESLGRNPSGAGFC